MERERERADTKREIGEIVEKDRESEREKRRTLNHGIARKKGNFINMSSVLYRVYFARFACVYSPWLSLKKTLLRAAH